MAQINLVKRVELIKHMNDVATKITRHSQVTQFFGAKHLQSLERQTV